MKMIDSIIGFDEEMKCPIFMSDVYPYEDYEEIKEGDVNEISQGT